MAVVVFLSAVSQEFHELDPNQPQRFESYRYILERSLNRLGPGYQVIVQETLAQGFGDLLQTLDEEVASSDIIVHLIGEMAGASPQAATLRRLHERHPDLLSHEPELAKAIGELDGISYTQFEFYLALEHRIRRLAFLAEPTAPRSPLMLTDEQQRESQAEHVRRLKLVGEHPELFADQRDLALKVVTSVVRRGLGPQSPLAPPSPKTVQVARENAPEMMREIALELKRASNTAAESHDPAGIEAYLRSIDTASLKHELDRRTTLLLVQEQVEQNRRNCKADPTAANLYELAFAELAMGNYPAAMSAAQQSANLARAQMTDSDQWETYRGKALSALLILSEAAQLAHRHAESIAALEEGGTLIDQSREAVFWADFHQILAEKYLTYAQFKGAESLIDQIVDIREDHQGEANPAFPESLLLWCRLLDIKANYQGVIGVASRAQRLFAAQLPPNLSGISDSLIFEGSALYALGRYREAEPLMRQALAIDEQCCGPDHPDVARDLKYLARSLHEENRLADAEPLMRRALAINEKSYGAEHPAVAVDLNNLARSLQDTNRHTDAEPLMRRALAINELSYGTEHPDVATVLHNLARLLQDTNRLAEAEPLMRRALAIFEQSYGAADPHVAAGLNNLAGLLQDTNRLEEAEPLMRRALAIFEQSYGAEHPHVGISLNYLTGLLQDMGRLEETEPLMCRALAINEQSYGAEHPQVAQSLSNLARLLQATNRLAEAEPLMRRALAITVNFKLRNGHDHSSYKVRLEQYSDLLQTMKLPEAEVAQKLEDAAAGGVGSAVKGVVHL